MERIGAGDVQSNRKHDNLLLTGSGLGSSFSTPATDSGLVPSKPKPQRLPLMAGLRNHGPVRSHTPDEDRL